MLETEKSDFGAPVAGAMLVGVAALTCSLWMLNTQYGFLEGGLSYPAVRILALLLLLAGGISLWKAFIVEGATFGLAGLTVYAVYVGADALILAVAAGAAVTALMALRAGDLPLAAEDLLLAAAGVLALGALDLGPVASGAALLLVAALSFCLAASDWALVQDVVGDYVDEVFGDDEDGDGCGCAEGGADEQS